MNKILYLFVRGLLFLFPIGATLVLIVICVRWVDGLLAPLLHEMLGFYIPGTGLIAVFIIVVLIGYLITVFGKSIDYFINRVVDRMPLVKIVYNGLRDFSEALLGDKKKFTQPVMVKTSDSGMFKLGFVTQNDLTQLGMGDLVAVYFPHSYNFSGNLFLVPKDKVNPIQGNSTEIMKFIVSAGVMSIENIVDPEDLGANSIIKNKPIKDIR